MNTIAVSELRAKLMRVLKKIEGGSEIAITSRGKIVAKLVPPGDDSEEAKKKLKQLSKTSKVGDVISPIETEWKVS